MRDYTYHNSDATARELARRASSFEAIALDLEWDSHDEHLPLQLIQLGIPHQLIEHIPHLIDVQHCSAAVDDSIGALLSNTTQVKVLHDLRQDAQILRSCSIALGKAFDTQVAHEVLRGQSTWGLERVLKAWIPDATMPNKRRGKELMKQRNIWSQRPLQEVMLAYAADDVRHLLRLYNLMHAEAIAQGKLEEIFRRSNQRATPKTQASAEKAAHKQEQVCAAVFELAIPTQITRNPLFACLTPVVYSCEKRTSTLMRSSAMSSPSRFGGEHARRRARAKRSTTGGGMRRRRPAGIGRR